MFRDRRRLRDFHNVSQIIEIFKSNKNPFKYIHGIYRSKDREYQGLFELESDRKFLSPIISTPVLDKIIDLERRDQREIAIRPHPHEFYLYFDV